MKRYSTASARPSADVVVARRVVPVLHRRRDDPGRRRGHERPRERRVRDERALGLGLGGVAVGDIADGGGGAEQVHLDALEPRHLQLEEVGMLGQVAHEGPLTRVAEAGHAVLHVGEEAFAGLLAVVADVDSGRVLRGDHVGGRPFDGVSELVGIDRLAAAAAAVHLRERRRTRAGCRRAWSGWSSGAITRS